MQPPPIPRYTSERRSLKKAFRIVGGFVGALIFFGVISNGAGDNKVAAQAETFPTAQVGDRVQFTKRMCNSTLIYSVQRREEG
jgi:hypothetical protein